MTKFNPVLLKEVRERFRTHKTALLVSLYLLVIGGFSLGYIFLSLRNTTGFFQPWRSKEIFSVLSVSQLVLLAFVIPGLTSGTISGERERQTLNVLLTTKLTPMGILFSKMVTSCSFMVLLLIATLPLYSVVFIFGGISPHQVIGLMGFFLVTIFLFAAIGIACSTYFKRSGVSTVTAYGIVFVVGAGTGFLAVFLWEIYRMNSPLITQTPLIVQLLLNCNPVVVLMRILGENITLGQEQHLLLPYWGIYVTTYILTGILLLLWSAVKLDPQRISKSFLLYR